MAFQAGGPHALDRALEAVAYAYAEQTRHPGTAELGEAAGQGRPAADDEDLPRGAARRGPGDRLQHLPDLELVPGPVRLAGHRQPGDRQAAPARGAAAGDHRPGRPGGAGRGRLRPEPGAAGRRGARARARLDAGRCARRCKIIDFTGSTAFGDWLEANARQAQVYTEKAGVNTVVIDSTDDFAGMCRNLAFSLSLYSGQMCTTPQNLLIPPDGIDTDAGAQELRRGGRRDLAAAVGRLPGDDARAVELTRRDRQRRRCWRGWTRPPSARRGGAGVACGRRTRPSPTRWSARRRWSEAGRGRRRDVYGASASARSPSRSPPTPPRTRWSCCARTVRREGRA